MIKIIFFLPADIMEVLASGQGQLDHNDLGGISNVSMCPTKRKISEIRRPRSRRRISEDDKKDNDHSSLIRPKPSAKKGHVTREAESSNGKRTLKKQCVASNGFEEELDFDEELIFLCKLKARSRRSDCRMVERSSKDAGMKTSESNNATLSTSSAVLSSSTSSSGNNNSRCSVRKTKVICNPLDLNFDCFSLQFEEKKFFFFCYWKSNQVVLLSRVMGRILWNVISA